MSGPQCCSNPPTLDPSSGAGHVENFAGLNTYITGSPDSKSAILLITDIFGYEAPNSRDSFQRRHYKREKEPLKLEMEKRYKLKRIVADKVAAAGFYVVTPDFFYGDPFQIGNLDSLNVWLQDHGTDKGLEDAKQVIDALKSKGFSSVGAAGFCWGGKVVAGLGKYELIQAAVMLHPSFVTLDDIKDIMSPLAVLGCEIDDYSPPALVKQFGQVLDSRPEVDGYVKVFLECAHGWTLRYSMEDDEACKKADEAHGDMLEWFHKYLK